MKTDKQNFPGLPEAPPKSARQPASTASKIIPTMAAAEKPKPAAGAGRGGRKPIIDDDDEPIGGRQAGYSAAVAYENKQQN